MPLMTGDDEILTPGTSAAVPLTASKLRKTNASGLTVKCERVELYVETYPVRFRKNGGAPTSTLGALLQVGDILTLRGNADLTNLQLIGIGGTASVFVMYLYPV